MGSGPLVVQGEEGVEGCGSQQELVQQWAVAASRGDRGALEQLVGAFEGAIYRLSLRILGDAGLAEDARQETFMEMIRSLGRFDRQRRFSTWILSIATHVALRMARQRQPWLEEECGALAEEPVQDPLAACMTREDLGRVSQALPLLAPRQRALLALVFQEGLKPAEIAELFGLSANQVRVGLWRARCALQSALQVPAGQRAAPPDPAGVLLLRPLGEGREPADKAVSARIPGQARP